MYKTYDEVEFIPGNYRLRASNKNEIRDFYFEGEGDYIYNCICELLESGFISVNVSRWVK